MSDYSNISFEKVADLPPQTRDPRHSKPLAPVNIFETLPFLLDLKSGETVKFAIPEDCFGYSKTGNTDRRGSASAKYDSLKSALIRTFSVLAERPNQYGQLKFIARVVGDDLYIKRLND